MRRAVSGLVLLGLALVVLGVVLILWPHSTTYEVAVSRPASVADEAFTIVTWLDLAGAVAAAAGVAVLSGALGLRVGARHGHGRRSSDQS